MCFGAESDFTAWHALCRATGIGDPLPRTCEQREEVRARHGRLNAFLLTQSTDYMENVCQYCRSG